MMGLLVYKEKLKNFYAEHEFYVNPIIKFISAFIALTLIKKNVGYNDLLTMWPVIMGISVIMAFMPWTIIITALTAIMCINIFTLSIELGALVVIILLIMLLLYFRFTPTQGIFVLFVPIAFFLKIPYIVPIIAGLICTPVSIVSVTFGTIVYYMIAVIGKNADAIQNVASEGTNAANLNTVLKMISVNNQLFLVIAAFIITTLVVYFIRKSSVNNAWIIAIIVGGVADCVIILVGALTLNTEYSIIEVILGSVGSILLGCIIQFFVFSVDYSRTELTQFEDDEYIYYVKAVPKALVSESKKSVKKFTPNSKVVEEVRLDEVRQNKETKAYQQESQHQEIKPIPEENLSQTEKAHTQDFSAKQNTAQEESEAVPVERVAEEDFDFEKQLEESLKNL